MTAQYPMARPVKRQSLKMHLLLFCVAPILGNWCYARYCNSHFASKYSA